MLACREAERRVTARPDRIAYLDKLRLARPLVPHLETCGPIRIELQPHRTVRLALAHAELRLARALSAWLGLTTRPYPIEIHAGKFVNLGSLRREWSKSCIRPISPAAHWPSRLAAAGDPRIPAPASCSPGALEATRDFRVTRWLPAIWRPS